MNTHHRPTRSASALLLVLFVVVFLSLTHQAFAYGGCTPASASLNSGSYSANVGSTFSVTLTFSPSGVGCIGTIQDNSLGSFATTTTSGGTYVDCDGTACSAFTTSPTTATLKCEAVSTFSIRGENSVTPTPSPKNVYSSNSTVTCSASASAPTVTTNSATSITTNSATLGGSITATGGADATQNGFAYGTVANLSTVISTTTLGGMSGTGSFSSAVASLTAGITYYHRAYATNSGGTGYGSILNFSTGAPARPSMMEVWGGFLYIKGGSVRIK
jgi:hypothetical protein